MAMSTCVRCGNSHFEMVEQTPSGSEYVLEFIQCSKCGGVAGILDYHNVGELVLRLADKLNLDLRN